MCRALARIFASLALILSAGAISVSAQTSPARPSSETGAQAEASEQDGPADRTLEDFPGIDLEGASYDVRLGGTREDCPAACLSDPRCEAVSYDLRLSLCELKRGIWIEKPAPQIHSTVIRSRLHTFPGTEAGSSDIGAEEIGRNLPLTRYDKDRLRSYDDARAKAVSIARAQGRPEDIAELNEILSGELLPFTGFDPTGEWQCRKIVLDNPNMPLTIYGWFTCRISRGGEAWYMEKLTGSHLSSGYVYGDGDTRLIYLGAYHAESDASLLGKHPRPEKDGTWRDDVAYVVRPSEERLRFESPQPGFGTTFTILELRRAPPLSAAPSLGSPEEALASSARGGSGGGGPAGRRTIRELPDADLHGADYAVRKGVAIEECRAACLSDQQCRAFTYNTQVSWCFLKQGTWIEKPNADAHSGVVQANPIARSGGRPGTAVLSRPEIGVWGNSQQACAGFMGSDHEALLIFDTDGFVIPQANCRFMDTGQSDGLWTSHNMLCRMSDGGSSERRSAHRLLTDNFLAVRGDGGAISTYKRCAEIEAWVGTGTSMSSSHLDLRTAVAFTLGYVGATALICEADLALVESAMEGLTEELGGEAKGETAKFHIKVGVDVAKNRFNLVQAQSYPKEAFCEGVWEGYGPEGTITPGLVRLRTQEDQERSEP